MVRAARSCFHGLELCSCAVDSIAWASILFGETLADCRDGFHVIPFSEATGKLEPCPLGMNKLSVYVGVLDVLARPQCGADGRTS
jgi:hypothetical protein